MNSMKQEYEIKLKRSEMDRINIEKDSKFEIEQQKYEI